MAPAKEAFAVEKGQPLSFRTAMSMKDYYKILGISDNDRTDDIGHRRL